MTKKILSEQDFKREIRYVVFKAKDLDCLDALSQFTFSELCKRVNEVRTQRGKDGLECIVIESDWPEYETVWQMIEARMTSKGSCEDEDTVKRFRGILSMLGIGAPESDESLMLCQFSLLGMVRHKIQQLFNTSSADHVTPSALSHAFIGEVIKNVAELPDRNRPEYWPEAMLVTGDELREIMLSVHQDVPAISTPQESQDAAARINELESFKKQLQFIISSDSYACEFQSIGQYRSSLLKAITQMNCRG